MSATSNGIGVPNPGRRSRRKGARGELGVLAELHRHGWTHARRNFASGSQGGGDLVGGPDGVHWEIKFQEALNIWKALAQAEADARPTDTPVVCFRRTRSKFYVALELEEYLVLLKMREQG